MRELHAGTSTGGWERRWSLFCSAHAIPKSPQRLQRTGSSDRHGEVTSEHALLELHEIIRWILLQVCILRNVSGTYRSFAITREGAAMHDAKSDQHKDHKEGVAHTLGSHWLIHHPKLPFISSDIFDVVQADTTDSEGCWFGA